MDQDSPYSPPRAGYAAGKDHIVYEEVSPLSLTQRLNRLRYACYQLSSLLVIMLAAILMGAFAGRLNTDKGDWLPLGIIAAAGLMTLLAIIYFIVLMVRRLHDLGHSGWLVLVIVAVWFAPALVMWLGGSATLLLLVSMLQPLSALYLLAAAGQQGMNAYGTPNPPNGMLVKLFGGFWWVLMVLVTLFSFASIVLSAFAPELLNSLGLETQQQQWQQVEKLLRGSRQ